MKKLNITVEKPTRIKAGLYKYKDYSIRCHGYYPPDKCIWWEAVNEKTNCADYHNTTLRGIIEDINEYE
jgi:hypothetical protein